MSEISMKIKNAKIRKENASTKYQSAKQEMESAKNAFKIAQEERLAFKSTNSQRKTSSYQPGGIRTNPNRRVLSPEKLKIRDAKRAENKTAKLAQKEQSLRKFMSVKERLRQAKENFKMASEELKNAKDAFKNVVQEKKASPPKRIGKYPTGQPSARRASTGRASTGRASTGRASTGRASTGRASTGRASTGRASTRRATRGRR